MHPTRHALEQQRILSAIHHMLHSTDDQMRDLEKALELRDRTYDAVVQDASSIIDRFSYTVELAEEKIRQGFRRGYLSREQANTLHEEIHAAVARMAERSRHSEVLTQILREKFGADVVG